MSVSGHESCVEYEFNRKTVFDAILESVPKIEKFEMDSADEISGRINLNAGYSRRSYGEVISIQLMEMTPSRTQMKVSSAPKVGCLFGGIVDFGKNRDNIEIIINAVSEILSTKSTKEEKNAPASSTSAMIEELTKLKGLLDSGVLSKEEFEELKNRII